MLASTAPLSSPTCSASPVLPFTGRWSENEPAPARASAPSLPDKWLRCPAGTPLRDSTALLCRSLLGTARRSACREGAPRALFRDTQIGSLLRGSQRGGCFPEITRQIGVVRLLRRPADLLVLVELSRFPVLPRLRCCQPYQGFGSLVWRAKEALDEGRIHKAPATTELRGEAGSHGARLERGGCNSCSTVPLVEFSREEDVHELGSAVGTLCRVAMLKIDVTQIKFPRSPVGKTRRSDDGCP